MVRSFAVQTVIRMSAPEPKSSRMVENSAQEQTGAVDPHASRASVEDLLIELGSLERDSEKLLKSRSRLPAARDSIEELEFELEQLGEEVRRLGASSSQTRTHTTASNASTLGSDAKEPTPRCEGDPHARTVQGRSVMDQNEPARVPLIPPPPSFIDTTDECESIEQAESAPEGNDLPLEAKQMESLPSADPTIADLDLDEESFDQLLGAAFGQSPHEPNPEKD
jgi:hypothetical protein